VENKLSLFLSLSRDYSVTRDSHMTYGKQSTDGVRYGIVRGTNRYKLFKESLGKMAALDFDVTEV